MRSLQEEEGSPRTSVHVKTQQEDNCLQTKERGFSRNQPCGHIHLKNVLLLFKPCSLWSFVMEPQQTNTPSHWWLIMGFKLQHSHCYSLPPKVLMAPHRDFSPWFSKAFFLDLPFTIASFQWHIIPHHFFTGQIIFDFHSFHSLCFSMRKCTSFLQPQ